MKINIHSFLSALLTAALISGFVFTTSSCKDEPTAEEIFRKKIALTWKTTATGVQFNGKDVNAIFNGFTLTFTEAQTYTTTSGNTPVWPASGKFTTVPTTSTIGFNLKRDDGVVIEITQLTETKLVLKFNYTGKPNRVSSVSGGYVFDLEKK
jgi:hypothetical protein